MQYKDLAADGGLYPVLRRRRKLAAPQLPPGCKTGVAHPWGLGTGSLRAPGLGGAAVGLGGGKRVGLNWWGERREPRVQLKSRTFPQCGWANASKETLTGKKGERV